ncbi:MAG: Coagulation factor protein [Ignavibacteriales bacterium UTCHB2]|jgi:hypothetical protein|nr:MAG: Coagulation factor protein [Ignavibacteriales bacterium UTCHB2]HQI42194.1 choice-of-anchor D domain-containing protein [Ignavibacteriaceae bacterium]
MRKLFSTFFIFAICTAVGFAQLAQIDLPLRVVNGSYPVKELKFGLDETATTGIDLHLGEAGAPPFPPPGAFDAKWDLVPYGVNWQVYKDYRNAPSFPYTGDVEHTILWQMGTGAPSVVLEYELPTGASIVIKDALTGGSLFNSGTLTGTGSYTVPMPAANSAKMTVTYTNIAPAVPHPIFGIAPASLNFGNLNVGSSSTLQATVSNSGDADLVLSGVTSSDPQFTFTPNVFPITVAPSASAVFDVTFSPTAAGTQNGNLVFTHNASGSPTNYSLTGVGISTVPVFQVNPASLNFGNTNVGASKTLNVTVSNLGTVDPLVVSSAAIAASEFVVSPTSATIPAGGSQVFQVTFSPTAAVAYSGTLVFTHNASGSPNSVNLLGNGYVPPAEYGLIFDSVSVHVPDNAFYTNYLHLLDLQGSSLHALQFRLLTNLSVGDDVLLTFQSIQKNHSAIAGSNWVLETNLKRGPIQANGASKDTIYVLLYNLTGTGDLGPGNYTNLFKVNYKVAKLLPASPEKHSTFRIFNAEGSTIEGNPLNVAPSRSVFDVYVHRSGGNFGDINGDGCVDILDLIKIVDHIVGRDSLHGAEFTRADLAPWVPGNSDPDPDGVVNVQDLSVLQNVILTGFFPSGEPVGSCGSGLPKFNGNADATVNLYINNQGIEAYLDSKVAIRGAQLEFGNVSNNPDNMIIKTDLGQGFYMKTGDLLRTLMYDRFAEKYIDAGVNFMANMPFVISNPNDITLDKIVLVDLNKKKVINIQVNVVYGTPVPLDYILFQNYPNPFNPNTSVKFQVPEDGLVTIKIFDMLGQEIATLISDNIQKGTYTLNWDGKDKNGNYVSSGSYMYRMTAGNFVQTKKMMFLK